MSEFSFTIGARDAEKNTVPVTFTVDGKNYSRDVNAALVAGAYDASDTMVRVLDVGRGMLNKIALGVLLDDETIAAQAPVVEPEPTQEPGE